MSSRRPWGRVWSSGLVITYGRRVRILAGLAPRWVALDAGIGAVSLAVSALLARHAASAQAGTRPLDALGYALMVLACAAVTARRVVPLPVLAVVAGALVVFAVRNYSGGPLLAPVTVALYSAGAAVERRTALAVGAVVAVIVIVRAWLNAAQGQVSSFTWAAPGWVLASFAWGAAVRSRRQLLESARLRAELAERTREAEAERRADAERLRIARDLHDVIGHSFAAVNVQARMARAVLETDKGGTRQALEAIEAISRTALAEIRQTLGMLRGGGPPGQIADPAGLAAKAGLLLEPLRQAGIGVDARVDLGDGPLPPEAAEAVYRVVQESLANVLRHADPATVRLSICRDHGTIAVEIVNDGTQPARGRLAGRDGPRGHGIAGMRERVTALGGELTAGPARSGFTVRATVPARER